jgi:5-deoxy-glucuronate isomerase
MTTGRETASRALHWPAGSLARPDSLVSLTPERAGWEYAGLRVVEIAPGGRLEVVARGEELAVVPLAGGLEVRLEGCVLALQGRESVFTRVTDWAYLPVDTRAELWSAAGCAVALPSARAEHRFAPVRVDARDVPVEVRGAGPATRQVTNFMTPDAFPDADRLMCVEVLTPDGNWSSYPPHRHDCSPGCPVANEEIYYFRVGRLGRAGTSAEGMAVHRLYDPEQRLDVCAAIGDGDVFCIPRGYHGPSIAAPGYPLYYLNVLAGRGPGRSMAFCDDPAHRWVRESWGAMAPDPRCPMTGTEELGVR